MHVGRRRDFSGNHRETRGDQRLTGDTGLLVLGQEGIQDGIGDLICDLVRVPLGDGLRCEEMTIGHATL